MLKFIKLYKELIISLGLALLLMGILQIPNRDKLADPDGFYHAKVSQLLEHGQLKSSFPYLIYTTWKDGFADQHYLYHVLLIPFNNIDHLYLSIIFFTLFAVLGFYFLLHKFGISYKWLWILLMLLGSVDFLFRANLVKANTLSLLLLFLLMYCLWSWETTRKQGSLWLGGIISFLFVWTYGGFVFIPVVVGVYFVVIAVSKNKIVIAPVLACAGGILLGLILHPHHQNLLTSLYNQIFLTGLGAGKVVPAGNEWLPYNLDWFAYSDIPVLLIWILGSIVAFYQLLNKKITWLILWTQVLALILLLFALLHRRFIEYFVPFAVLSAAITLSPYLIRLQWQDFKQSFRNWQVACSMLVFGLIILSAFYYNFHTVYGYLNTGELTHAYQKAAQLIASRSQPGDIVINTQWDEFPQLFYWNNKNYYPVGMDPTFMYIYNSDLYWKWRIIADQDSSKWESVEYIHELLAKDLRAKYLFVDSNRNPDLPVFIANNDSDSAYFDLIYSQNSIEVYEVK